MSLIDRALGALQVQQNERLAIGLLLAHSFSIGIFISYYLAYANGAFMGLFEATDLPLTYVLSGVTGFVASAVFAHYQKRIAYGRLAVGTLVTIGAVVAAFMVGVWIDPMNKPLIFALFLGLIPVLGLIGLQFGGMIMQLFDLRQGKRLYGVIASGEVVSSMIWFFTIPVILKLGLVPDGQPWMLLGIALVGLGLGLFFQVLLIRRFPATFSRQPKAAPVAADGVKPSTSRKAWRLPKLQFDQPYFALVFFLMLFSTLGRVFVDYSFMDAAKATFAGSLTAFFGTFFGLLKVIELITNTFFASRLLSKYGIKLGLLILPTLLAVFALVAIVGHWTVGLEVVFLGLAMNKLFDKTVRTSLELPSFKTLYQPLSEEEKFKLQTQTEGQAGQFGVFMAGGLLMLFIALFPQFKMMEATYFLVIILVGWLILARRTVRAYRHTVIEKINSLQMQEVAPAPTPALNPTAAPPLPDSIRATLTAAPAHEYPYLVAKYLPQLDAPQALIHWLTQQAPQQLYPALLPLLAPTPLGRTAFLALKEAPFVPDAFARRVGQLAPAPHLDSPQHLTLLQLIALYPHSADPAWLLTQAQHPLATVRQAALAALHGRHFACTTPEERRTVKALLQRTLRHYLYLLATQLDTADAQHPQWHAALAGSRSDAYESIFAQLALLYDAPTLFQIQRNLSEGTAQEALAIEMADILLDEDIKELILPILDRISDTERLKLLHTFAPQQRLSSSQRLLHIAQYDYTHGSLWLRYHALQAIAATPEPPQALIAHIHHPEPTLREAAYSALYQHHEAHYYRLVAQHRPPQLHTAPPAFATRYHALHTALPQLSQATCATLALWATAPTPDTIAPLPQADALAWQPAVWDTLCDTLPALVEALKPTVHAPVVAAPLLAPMPPLI